MVVATCSLAGGTRSLRPSLGPPPQKHRGFDRNIFKRAPVHSRTTTSQPPRVAHQSDRGSRTAGGGVWGGGWLARWPQRLPRSGVTFASTLAIAPAGGRGGGHPRATAGGPRPPRNTAKSGREVRGASRRRARPPRYGPLDSVVRPRPTACPLGWWGGGGCQREWGRVWPAPHATAICCRRRRRRRLYPLRPSPPLPYRPRRPCPPASVARTVACPPLAVPATTAAVVATAAAGVTAAAVPVVCPHLVVGVPPPCRPPVSPRIFFSCFARAPAPIRW